MHEESGDRHAEARILGNLGNVYAKTEEFDRAIGYLQRALDLHEQHGDAFGVAGVTGSLISVLINTKRFDEAAKMLDKQASMSASMENPMVSSMHEAHRGDIAQHMGELDDTWRHLQRAVEIATQAGMRSEAAEFHRRLRDLAKQRNDFEGYIHHNDEYQRITEEVRGKEATQRMTMMEAERKMEGERRERERERAVLYSTLPRHVADRVIRGEEVTDHFTNAAVFFSDVVSFTSNSSEMSAPDVVRLLESMFKTFDELCAEHGITKVKTIGDAYLCFKGDEGGSGNALAIAQFALAVQRAAFMWPSGQPLTLRIGLHIGPATAGVIGTERLQYDIWGDTVNVASRMESTGEPGRIHVSDVFVLALANESFDLQRRGDVEVKGKGLMTTYWLEGAD